MPSIIIYNYFPEKEQTILISAKYNNKCTKEIKLSCTRRFSVAFLNEIQIFVVKNKINEWIWLKLSQTYGSTVSFLYFETFFLKIPMIKKFSHWVG